MGATMDDRPVYVVIASILALAGAVAALAVAVNGLDIEAEGLLTKMAFSLLTMALFLAVAGSLNMNGQWSWRFLIFAEVLCAAVPAAGYAFGAIDLIFSAVIVIIAIFVILITTAPGVKRWVDADRA